MNALSKLPVCRSSPVRSCFVTKLPTGCLLNHTRKSWRYQKLYRTCYSWSPSGPKNSSHGAGHRVDPSRKFTARMGGSNHPPAELCAKFRSGALCCFACAVRTLNPLWKSFSSARALRLPTLSTFTVAPSATARSLPADPGTKNSGVTPVMLCGETPISWGSGGASLNIAIDSLAIDWGARTQRVIALAGQESTQVPEYTLTRVNVFRDRWANFH